MLEIMAMRSRKIVAMRSRIPDFRNGLAPLKSCEVEMLLKSNPDELEPTTHLTAENAEINAEFILSGR